MNDTESDCTAVTGMLGPCIDMRTQERANVAVSPHAYKRFLQLDNVAMGAKLGPSIVFSTFSPSFQALIHLHLLTSWFQARAEAWTTVHQLTAFRPSVQALFNVTSARSG